MRYTAPRAIPRRQTIQGAVQWTCETRVPEADFQVLTERLTAKAIHSSGLDQRACIIQFGGGPFRRATQKF